MTGKLALALKELEEQAKAPDTNDGQKKAASDPTNEVEPELAILKRVAKRAIAEAGSEP